MRPLTPSRLRLLSLLAVLLPAAAWAAERPQLVVLVSFDGCRGDAIARATTPTVDSLTRAGAYTWLAQTVVPSTTLTGHASMLTGLTPNRHGILTDTFNPGEAALGQPTCLQQCARAGLWTGMIVSKSKLKRLAPTGAAKHFSYAGYWAKQVAAEAVKLLKKQHRGLLFLHFSDPDSLGHQQGWMSAGYLKSVGDCDRALGTVLRTVEDLGLRNRTLLLVTADHGGHGKVHGTRDRQDTTIPWIIAGPGIAHGRELKETVHVYDTAPTILQALGLPVPVAWDGKPVAGAFDRQPLKQH